MADITASQVKELREVTGAPMMDCKTALAECGGDVEKAVDALRTKGLADLAKKSGRATREGLVATFVSDDGTIAVVAEVNCETDFVARNDECARFVAGVVSHVAGAAPADVDAMRAQPFEAAPSLTVEQALGELVAKLGENMGISRFERWELTQPGVFGAYVHGIGRIGVLVELGGASDAEAATKAKDIAMHVAASSPGWVDRASVPADVIERERAIYSEQAAQTGKPEQIVAKIVDGKLEKFYQHVCLLEQPFVKDDSLTVEKYLGADLSVRRFARFKLGEGAES